MGIQAIHDVRVQRNLNSTEKGEEKRLLDELSRNEAEYRLLEAFIIKQRSRVDKAEIECKELEEKYKEVKRKKNVDSIFNFLDMLILRQKLRVTDEEAEAKVLSRKSWNLLHKGEMLNKEHLELTTDVVGVE